MHLTRALAALSIAVGAVAAAPAANAEESGSALRPYVGNVFAMSDDSFCRVNEGGGVACVGSGPAAALTEDLRAQHQGLDGITIGGTYGCGPDFGSVTCWGDQPPPMTGADGEAISTTMPLGQVDFSGRRVAHVAAGDDSACAVLDDGGLSCWGGVTGTSSPAPMLLPAGRTAVEVSTDVDHACALLGNRSIACWGDNFDGQLGTTTSNGQQQRVLDPQTPELPVGRHATAVTVGLDFSCALLDDGTVACWGHGQYGQLGDASRGDAMPHPDPQLVPIGAKVTAISARGFHACAVTVDARLLCWGYNDSGDIGLSTDGATAGPTQTVLPAGRTVFDVATSTHGTCAVLDDNSVVCYGAVSYASPAGAGSYCPRCSGAAGDPGPVALSVRAGQSSYGLTMTSPVAGTVVVHVVNKGPDAAVDPIVEVYADPAISVTATQGQYVTRPPYFPYWQVGPLAPGRSATLTVHVRATDGIHVPSYIAAVNLLSAGSVDTLPAARYRSAYVRVLLPPLHPVLAVSTPRRTAGGATVRLICRTGPCGGTAALRHGGSTLGTPLTFGILDHVSRTITLRLGPHARAALAAAHRAGKRYAVTVAVTPISGTRVHGKLRTSLLL
ncbi:MAG TPA: hypothetical protein VHE83_12155 [Mycobacteriales bacterium]|nr:hypothetical protein [Mycobacteriales bacterium]